MGLGILGGLLFYELTGLSPGGIVAPAYVAVFLDHPTRIAGTVLVSVATHLVMRALGGRVILYGRRRTGLTLAIGFLLQAGWEGIATSEAAGGFASGFAAIGFIVPGLIAADMERQGILRTWAGLLIVAAAVWLVIAAIQGVGWL